MKLDIDDIIDGTLRAAEIDGIEKKILNLGGWSRVSINNVVKLLVKQVGKEGMEPIYEPPKLGHARARGFGIRLNFIRKPLFSFSTK